MVDTLKQYLQQPKWRLITRLVAVALMLIGAINMALDIHRNSMIDGTVAAIILVVGVTVLVLLVPYRPTRLWWQRPF